MNSHQRRTKRRAFFRAQLRHMQEHVAIWNEEIGRRVILGPCKNPGHNVTIRGLVE